MAFVIQWVDLLWLPAAFFVVHKAHRWMALAFVAACLLMLRLQAELMTSIGYPQGILTLMQSDVLFRGMAVYGVFFALYLVLSYYSPGTRGVIYMAASLTIFFMAMVTSMILMVL